MVLHRMLDVALGNRCEESDPWGHHHCHHQYNHHHRHQRASLKSVLGLPNMSRNWWRYVDTKNLNNFTGGNLDTVSLSPSLSFSLLRALCSKSAERFYFSSDAAGIVTWYFPIVGGTGRLCMTALCIPFNAFCFCEDDCCYGRSWRSGSGWVDHSVVTGESRTNLSVRFSPFWLSICRYFSCDDYDFWSSQSAANFSVECLSNVCDCVCL